MALSALTATLRAFLQYRCETDLTGLNDPAQEQDITKQVDITFGTASGNCNQIYAAVRTLNANTTEDLDLYGSLTNPLGEVINFATIKACLVWLMATADTAPGDDTVTGTACSSITIGNDVASPALWFGSNTNTITIKNGGFFFYALPGTGFTVTNTTADVFQVQNDDAAVQAKYVLVLLGTQ